MQERHNGVPFEDFAWKKYHVADVVPDGDCQDRVNELSGQQQRRVLGVLGCSSGRDCRRATSSSFPRYDACRHEGR